MINKKTFTKVGITGMGIYLPKFRIKVSTIAKFWQQDSKVIEEGLGVKQKTVASKDEDSLTMAVEASLKALKMSGVNPKKIGAVFVGSESHPYAVKPTGTILGSFLGLKDYFCADLQFACKAGTAGIQIAAAMIEAGLINYGLVIASDKAQSRPGDALEYTAGAGAAAFVLGSKKDKFLAKVKSVYSVASDTPDFWRRPGCKYPEHTGRFTGEPSYFKHLTKSIKKILENNNLKIKDINKLVLHMPNAKFPLKLAKRLGVSKNQLKDSFLVPSMGNPYTASSFLGLAASLSQAKKNEKILMASYGSGAGSDGILLEAKTNKKAKTVNLKSQLKQGIYLNYADYLKHTNYLKI